MGRAEANPLCGRRILIVEDSYFIADAIKRIVCDHGGQVIGPASSVQAALGLLASESCDAALLDINLGRETSHALAEVLDRRGVPVIFVTAYSDPDLPDRLRSRPRVSKPVEPQVLLAQLDWILSGRANVPPVDTQITN